MLDVGLGLAEVRRGDPRREGRQRHRDRPGDLDDFDDRLAGDGVGVDVDLTADTHPGVAGVVGVHDLVGPAAAGLLLQLDRHVLVRAGVARIDGNVVVGDGRRWAGRAGVDDRVAVLVQGQVRREDAADGVAPVLDIRDAVARLVVGKVGAKEAALCSDYLTFGLIFGGASQSCVRYMYQHIANVLAATSSV